MAHDCHVLLNEHQRIGHGKMFEVGHFLALELCVVVEKTAGIPAHQAERGAVV